MHTRLKYSKTIGSLVFLFLALSLGSCADSTGDTPTTMTQDQLIERGKYLVEASDCNGCHSPAKLTARGFEIDSSLILAGYPENAPLPHFDTAAIRTGEDMHSVYGAFVGPWGVSFPANLTPDDATGLGGWDASIFIRTIRLGKYHGVINGRDLLPPMPWGSFRHFSDQDLTAMFTYLQSIPPVHNRVPDPIPFDFINHQKWPRTVASIFSENAAKKGD